MLFKYYKKLNWFHTKKRQVQIKGKKVRSELEAMAAKKDGKAVKVEKLEDIIDILKNVSSIKINDKNIKN